MIETITSVQNARVKQIAALQQKSAERRQSNLFVVEGWRETEQCLDAGYEIETLLFCPEIAREEGKEMAERLANTGTKVCAVTERVYEKLAYRGSTEGIVATVRAKHLHLFDLRLDGNTLIVVLESVEKPGNLGAILRSADAAGASAVVVCDPLTDLYNPNLIRASLGGIFTVPCVACSSPECIDFLKENGVQILTAQLQDSHPYYHTDMRRPTAIVMGTESTGLTDIWRKAADAHIYIPMLGRLDSLNVSVSTAILLYEAVRQRKT